MDKRKYYEEFYCVGYDHHFEIGGMPYGKRSQYRLALELIKRDDPTLVADAEQLARDWHSLDTVTPSPANPVSAAEWHARKKNILDRILDKIDPPA